MKQTNRIIDELRKLAGFNGFEKHQKEYYNQIAEDAKPVECVPMRDVFTPEQLRFLRDKLGYKAHRKMCYMNAAELVRLVVSHALTLTTDPVRYVEGYVYCYGLLPIEHAFVKVGDLYVDPTFERALRRDVRKEMYASCIELDPETMARYQLETGFYGELYVYDYMCKHRPELAAQIRARNPHNRQ